MDNLEIYKAKVKVIGIGDCGNNIISSLKRFAITNLELIAVNTDAKKLYYTDADRKVLFGEKITKGFGTGSNIEIAKKIAELERDKISGLVKDTDIVFFIAGLGRGTGSGMLPCFSEVAREEGVLSVAILIWPSKIEGGALKKRAEKTLSEIEGKIDSYIIIENDKVRELFGMIPLQEAFFKTNKIISDMLSNLNKMMFEPSELNIDFADVCTILKNTGMSTMSYFKTNDEKISPLEVSKQLISNPLISRPIKKVKNALIHYNISEDIPIADVMKIQDYLIRYMDTDGDIKYGVRNIDSVQKMHKIEIFTILAGIKTEESKKIDLGFEQV